jgi:hypothetical protein
VTFANLIQDLERTASSHHEVFRDNLEPVHAWTLVDNLRVMGPPQAHPEAEKGEIGAFHWHNRRDTGQDAPGTGEACLPETLL